MSTSTGIAPSVLCNAPRSFMRSARHRIYELLLSPEIDYRGEHWLRIAIAVLILVNVLVIMLETVHELNVKYGAIFLAIEYFSIVIFTLEYLLRFWAVVEIPKYSHPVWGRLRYSFTVFALIDLVAIAPFFIPAFVDIDLIFLRGLRLIRLLRVLKLGRYSDSIGMIFAVFRKKREDIVVSLMMILLILVLSSSLMYYLENQAQPKAFPNIFASLWWGVATLTTVGYGDVYPITVLGKLCAAVIALLGIGLVALPSGLLVAGFVDELQARREAGLDVEEEKGEHPLVPVSEEETAMAMKLQHEESVCPHCGRDVACNVSTPPMKK